MTIQLDFKTPKHTSLVNSHIMWLPTLMIGSIMNGFLIVPHTEFFGELLSLIIFTEIMIVCTDYAIKAGFELGRSKSIIEINKAFIRYNEKLLRDAKEEIRKKEFEVCDDVTMPSETCRHNIKVSKHCKFCKRNETRRNQTAERKLKEAGIHHETCIHSKECK